MPRIRILITDDHALVRAGLRSLLSAQPDLEVVGEAADGEEAVQLAVLLSPEVAVLDISMPVLNGIDAAREIGRLSPRTRSVLLTMHNQERYVWEAAQAGVAAYVLKTRTAADVVNGSSERDLAEIFFRYGEERASRRIARSVAARRPVLTTADLRRAVEEAVGARFLVKSLARVFQALRIEVNRELDQLRSALESVTPHLRPGGRLVVISYHSLEDRIVKDFFRGQAADRIPSGHPLVPDAARSPVLRVLTRHPVLPLPDEVERNPRARSAKLRAAEKVVGGG